MEKSSKQSSKDLLFNILTSQSLPESSISLLKDNIREIRFKKGECILKQGGRATDVMFISKGIVKHIYEFENGKELILTISSGPNLVGGAGLFSDGSSPFSIVVIEECDVCLIDIATLKKIIFAHSNFGLKLFEVVTEMFKASIFNFIHLAHKNVNGKVADTLLFLSNNVYRSENFILSLTRKELAQFAGISEENFITTMQRFHKENIIEVHAKQVKIVDIERLREISKRG